MKYLTHYLEERQTKIFQENGAFFAFSQKQFNEAKKENEKYVSVGAGLICPKKNTAKMLKELEKTFDSAIEEDLQDNGAAKIIEREFFNHETQLTYNFHDLKNDHLKPYFERYPQTFTDELFEKVCANCLKQAVKNDCF